LAQMISKYSTMAKMETPDTRAANKSRDPLVIAQSKNGIRISAVSHLLKCCIIPSRNAGPVAGNQLKFDKTPAW
jgi:hypothetical protein